MKNSVTVLGLGAMGTALARAFLAAGHTTTVWNRTPAKAQALAAEGALPARTAAEAVAAGELVVVCLVDYEAGQALLEPLAAELKGRVLVNLTSDTPERSREAATWAAKEGIDYLDGAIMVPVPVIGSPQALILYSGSQPAFAAHEQTLKALGGNAAYLGADHGIAALYDQGMLGAFYTGMAGFVQAFALVGADGVRAAEFLPFLQGIVDITPAILAGLAENIDEGNYRGHTGNLRMESAGIGHIIEASRARGIDASLLERVRELADRAIAAGHGEDGFARVVEEVRNPPR